MNNPQELPKDNLSVPEYFVSSAEEEKATIPTGWRSCAQELGKSDHINWGEVDGTDSWLLLPNSWSWSRTNSYLSSWWCSDGPSVPLWQQQGHREHREGSIGPAQLLLLKSLIWWKSALRVFCRASVATSPFSELQDKRHNKGHVLINFRNTRRDLKEKGNYLSGKMEQEWRAFSIGAVVSVNSKQLSCLLGDWPSPASLSTLL